MIDEVDDVLHEIMFDEPSFEGELRAKYFSHYSISSMPLYTKEELNYIKNLGTIKVKLIQDNIHLVIWKTAKPKVYGQRL